LIINTCRDCKYWNQPEWILKQKYTKPEDNVQGFCTWHPDYTKIPYYLQYYYGTIIGKRWDGVIQHRDTEACPVFENR
jgi:hypothetical protein